MLLSGRNVTTFRKKISYCTFSVLLFWRWMQGISPKRQTTWRQVQEDGALHLSTGSM